MASIFTAINSRLPFGSSSQARPRSQQQPQQQSRTPSSAPNSTPTPATAPEFRRADNATANTMARSSSQLQRPSPAAASFASSGGVLTPRLGGKNISRPVPTGGKVHPGGRYIAAGNHYGLGRRHKKHLRETIRGITKPDIRRLARRGGVKRMSCNVYDTIREVIKTRIKTILTDCETLLDGAGRKTITVADVIYALRKQGRPIYGFGDVTLSRR